MSGVYIKGMEMPDKCGHCRFATAFECEVTKNFITTFKVRQVDCPLVPIPPHGRLIDADEIDYYEVERNGEKHYMVWKPHIDGLPTIIPADKEDGE